MKNTALLILLFLSGATFAKEYSIIANEHTYEGCNYYDVEIWSDNGTPDDRSDDIKMGSGTINDCDRGVADPGGDPNGDLTPIIREKVQLEDNCFNYLICLLDQKGETVACGGAHGCMEE
tara:strand:- start:18 stop:377 length:360 start_codon:yes stop_codon:yes gene_type:complete